MGESDYTNGRPYLVTLRQSVGERSNAVTYLLPTGARRTVIIDTAIHTDDLEKKLGMALANGRVNLVKGRTE